MKNTIEWHENCAKNRKATLDRKRANLDRMQKEVDRSARSLNLYLAQINLAKQERKDGFDSERYAIKRLCTG